MLCEHTLCQQFHPLLGELGQDFPAQFSFLQHPCSIRHLFYGLQSSRAREGTAEDVLP